MILNAIAAGGILSNGLNSSLFKIFILKAIGADKRGVNQKRFYKDLIRLAEQRFQKHLVKMEGNHVKDP